MNMDGSMYGEETVEYTPEMAQELLRKAPMGQRGIRAKHAAQLGKLMKEGKWISELGIPIIINNDGLRNGRHRMTGLTKAGCAVKMRTWYNVPEDVMRYMDLGLRRNEGDVIAMAGYGNARKLASIINAEYAYHTQEGRVQLDVQTVDDVLMVVHDYPWLEDLSNTTQRIYSKTKASYGALGAALFIIQRDVEDKEAVAQFQVLLEHGAGMDTGHPVLRARERLISMRPPKDNSGNRAAMVRDDVIKAIMRGWNAFAEGRELHQMRPGTYVLPVQVQNDRWIKR